MEQKRCYGCMRIHQKNICEHCGYDNAKRNEPHQLSTGTTLKEQYIVGKVLWQEETEITYLGWDIFLEIPVEIKEYFPKEMVSRDVSVSNEIIDQSEGNAYQHQLERYIQDIRSQVDVSQEIRIKNFFQANHTVYVITEYVQPEMQKPKRFSKAGMIGIAGALIAMVVLVVFLGKNVWMTGDVNTETGKENVTGDEAEDNPQGKETELTYEWSFGKQTLYISGEGTIYENDRQNWLEYIDEIVYVEIGEGVTCVERNAFNGCSKLEEVILPKSMEKLEVYAFNGCPSLKKVWMYGAATEIECTDGATPFTQEDTGNYTERFMIYGYLDSTADTFIKEHGVIFCSMGLKEGVVAEGKCGENAAWRLENGKLYIDGTGNLGLPYDVGPYGVGREWDIYVHSIKEIHLGDGIYDRCNIRRLMGGNSYSEVGTGYDNFSENLEAVYLGWGTYFGEPGNLKMYMEMHGFTDISASLQSVSPYSYESVLGGFDNFKEDWEECGQPSIYVYEGSMAEMILEYLGIPFEIR